MGPFETEAQARAAAHAIIPPEPGWSILSEAQNYQLLERACEAAGVDPGAFGTRILRWLAGFDDAGCEAIADLIIRAREERQPEAPDYNGETVIVFNEAGFGDGMWRASCPINCGWHGHDHVERADAFAARALEAKGHKCLRAPAAVQEGEQADE
jgi:hypothetical protein